MRFVEGEIVEETQYVAVEKPNGEKIFIRDIQLKLLEVLREFDRICTKNDIEYVLAFGSMLGAIRHQGFIPWDDDLDVVMNRENYLKLLEVIDDEIGSDFYYHCFEKDKRYNITLPSMKFRIKNTYIKERNFLLNHGCEGDGLFLDVFIFDKISENEKVHLFHRFNSFLLMLPIVFFENIKINPVWLKNRLYNYALWYSNKYKDSQDVYLPLTWTFDSYKARLKEKDVFPNIKMKFEDNEYPVSNNYHTCLVASYGENYMTPVPLEKRYAKHTYDVNLNSDKPE